MKFLDLFAGIGGFRLGMEMAGHECVGHVEIDKYANKSYNAMHNPKESEYFGENITKIESRELPESDVWCGGFPCPAYSIAGRREGFKDPRGTVIFDILRLAKDKRPKILFLENVRGLLNHDRGRTFATILLALRECGYYDVQWQLLNSKHFGVPQNRERVFIIAYLRGYTGRKIFPIASDARKTDGKLKEVISGRMAERVGARTGVLRTENDISHTVRTGGKTSLTAKHNWDTYNINGRIRRLTPKECFRLQGFPDDYFERARKVNSDSQLYKQAGNGVTVNVIYEIAKRL